MCCAESLLERGSRGTLAKKSHSQAAVAFSTRLPPFPFLVRRDASVLVQPFCGGTLCLLPA